MRGFSRRALLPIIIGLALVAFLGWTIVQSRAPQQPAARPATPVVTPSTALEIALTPLGGTEKIDQDIAKLQDRIKTTPNLVPALLERLGWTLVEKARITNDPGFYKLAEQCADAIALKGPGLA